MPPDSKARPPPSPPAWHSFLIFPSSRCPHPSHQCVRPKGVASFMCPLPPHLSYSPGLDPRLFLPGQCFRYLSGLPASSPVPSVLFLSHQMVPIRWPDLIMTHFSFLIAVAISPTPCHHLHTALALWPAHLPPPPWDPSPSTPAPLPMSCELICSNLYTCCSFGQQCS